MKSQRGPKSLKEQLAPLKAKLKAEENAPKAPREATPPPKKKTPPPPAPAPPARLDEPDLSDAEVAEFWRAAADTVPIDSHGRQIREKKKPASLPPALTPQRAAREASENDRATFAELLDLTEDEISRALAEKEGRPPKPRRAMEKRRVSLEGLTPEDALERLARYLKAAQARGEPWVIVAFGKNPDVKWAAEGFLAQAGGLVETLSAAHEANAVRVTLAPRQEK